MFVEDMSRNERFPQVRISMFYVLYPFVTYLLTPLVFDRSNKISQTVQKPEGIHQYNSYMLDIAQ
jgi:hypothetical protein